jgi:hypothetical protein
VRPQPPKTQRNLELFGLRDKDPQTWTFKALGEKFGVSDVRAYQIYTREERRAYQIYEREERRNLVRLSTRVAP